LPAIIENLFGVLAAGQVFLLPLGKKGGEEEDTKKEGPWEAWFYSNL